MTAPLLRRPPVRSTNLYGAAAEELLHPVSHVPNLVAA